MTNETREERTMRIICGERRSNFEGGNFRVVAINYEQTKEGGQRLTTLTLIADGLSLPMAEKVQASENKRGSWSEVQIENVGD